MEELFDVSEVAKAIASVAVAAPPPLPQGWILKESRSHPGYFYYYNSETGVCTWQAPIENTVLGSVTSGDTNLIIKHENSSSISSHSSTKCFDTNNVVDEDGEKPSKRRKASAPSQVRVLHILKKHKDSRRPSSWRKPVITQTLEESRHELRGLLDILKEEEGNPSELQATFEELARTESDSSSAKRGGDLGFFARRKMQPAFEEAAFGLEVGELTKDLVETSSGVHILLRIG